MSEREREIRTSKFAMFSVGLLPWPREYRRAIFVRNKGNGYGNILSLTFQLYLDHMDLIGSAYDAEGVCKGWFACTGAAKEPQFKKS